MNRSISRTGPAWALFVLIVTVLLALGADRSRAQEMAPSPYVGNVGPIVLNHFAGAAFRAQEGHNRSELISPVTAQGAATSEATSAANSLSVASSVQTVDYLTDIGPGGTAPTGTPTNIDPVFWPSEEYITFASNGTLTTANGVSAFTVPSAPKFHLFTMLASDSATSETVSVGGVQTIVSVPPASLQQMQEITDDSGKNERWPDIISDTSLVFCQQQSDGFYHVIIGTIINNSNGAFSITNEQDITGSGNSAEGIPELDCEHPSFSGGYIVFAGRTSLTGLYHIYIYDIADANFTQLTTGTCDDENPSFSPVGGLIAFDSNAVNFVGTGHLPSLFGTPNPNAADVVRNIFVTNPAGTSLVQFTNDTANTAVNNIEPAWANVPVTSPNNGLGQQMLPSGQKIFFSSDRINGNYNIYWLKAVVQNSGADPVLPESGSNIAQLLKTSDPLGAGEPVGAANNFEPAPPQFNLYYTVLYTSPRFVQNLPTDNPLDNAVSSPPYSDDQEPGEDATSPVGAFSAADTEQSPTNGFEVLGSKLLDVDPPALIAYSTSEIIHTQADLTLPDTSASRFVDAGSSIHFVVRLSQRQSGIGQVYLQIKDPNSKYQDAAGLEHKVFTESPYAYGPYVPQSGSNATTGFGPQLHPNYDEATTLATYPLAPAFSSGGIAIGGLETADEATGIPTMLGHMLTSSPLINPTPIDVTGTYPTGGAPGQAVLTAITAGQVPADTITLSGVGGLADSDGVNHLAGDILALYDYAGNFVQYCQIVSSNYNLAGTAPISGTFEVTPIASAFTIPTGVTGYTNPGYAIVVATSRMDFMGEEVDCEAINVGDPTQQVNAALSSDFSIPEYTPGFDDATPQSGIGLAPGSAGYSPTPDPGVVGVRAVPETSSQSAIWLALRPVVSSSPLYDHKGGVLYEASWVTPNVPSDYYVDVVAYDNEDPQNWRIYDNVWGFTTKVFQTTTSPGGILLVNDYDLPQKFFTGRFGTLKPGNVPVNYFGAESYLTDIDCNYNDPNYSSQNNFSINGPPPAWVPDSAMNTDFDSSVGLSAYVHGRMSQFYHPFAGGIDQTTNVSSVIENNTVSYNYVPYYANTLGVNSYVDPDQDNVNLDADGPIAFPMTYYDNNVGGSASSPPGYGTGAPLGYNANGNDSHVLSAPSQHYDIWRVLSRGPIPLSVLNAYAPQVNTQPLDPINNNPKKNVLVASSCVIWSSPFAGDEFTAGGTIADPNVQSDLQAFVESGGRLYVEGADVGYALTNNGTASNTLYSTYLGAKFGTDAEPLDDATYQLDGLAGQTNYLGGDSFINNISTSAATDAKGAVNYPVQTGPVAHPNFKTFDPADDIYSIPNWTYGVPAAGRLDLAIRDGYADELDSVSDASLDDGAFFNNQVAVSDGVVNGFDLLGTAPPAVGPLTGAYESAEISGTNASPDDRLVYTTFAPQSGVDYGGAVTVYSSFGLESLSQGIDLAQSADAPGYASGHLYDIYSVEEQRTDLMQNIICMLRTGTLTGVVTSTSGGAVQAGVTVVATWAPSGSFATSTATTFTAITDSTGTYTITGVPAGRYDLAAYKPNYSFQHAGGSFVDVIGGDIGSLGLQISPASPGSLVVDVVDSNGQPVSGATVQPTEVSGVGGSLGSQVTGTSGSVTFTNVPAASYNVTVTDLPNYATYGPAPSTQYPGYEPATVTSDATTTYQVSLVSAPGTLTGVVTTSGGADYPGATITATLAGSSSAAGTATSGSDGSYTISDLTPGSYTVALTATGYSPQSDTDTIASNATTTQNFVINTTPILTGTVTDATTGAPVSGVTVGISPAAGSTTSTTTNSSGQYTIAGISGDASYTLTFTDSPDYITGSESFTTNATGATVENFALAEASVTPYTANSLAFFSLPYSYSPSLSIAQILEYSFADGTPKVALWNPQELVYDLSTDGNPATLTPGVGYWVRFPADFSGAVQAGTVETTTVSIPVYTGWNQIGDPFTSNEPVSALTFTENGSTISFSAAVSDKFASGTLWSYAAPTSPTLSPYTALDLTSNLVPYSGYWLQVNQDMTLNFPPP